MFVEQTVACMRIAGYDDDAITGFSQKNTEQQKKFVISNFSDHSNNPLLSGRESIMFIIKDLLLN